MTKTYKHSGKIGDIIWSLPFIIWNGVADVLYLQLTNEFTMDHYEYIKPLLLKQPSIREVKVYNGELVDFDLDKFRQVEIDGVNLAERYFYAFKQDFDKEQLHLHPWLYVPNTDGPESYILVTKGYGMPSRAPYNTGFGNFIDRGLKNCSVFVGLPSEHATFNQIYKCQLPYVEVKDALDMAQWVKKSSMVLGNQTSTTAIAEALKKTMFLERRIDVASFDCQFDRPNLFYI